MTNLERAQDLYKMIFSGQLLEAFDKYYADDIVMTEIGEEPRRGKAVNRAYEEKFVGGLAEVHGAAIAAIASNEETGHVLIENSMDFTHKEWGRQNMMQVSVQTWKDGQIIDEKFYHK